MGGVWLSERAGEDAVDNMLVSLWSLLCIFASHVVFQLGGANLRAVGWRDDRFTEPRVWLRHSLRFKLSLVVPVLLLFLRGVFAGRQGFDFAQKDTMLLTLLYPLVLTAIWCVGFCSTVLKWRDLLLLPPLLAASWVVCWQLGQVCAKGVVLAVALHMARALLRRKATPFPIHSRPSLRPRRPRPAHTARPPACGKGAWAVSGGRVAMEGRRWNGAWERGARAVGGGGGVNGEGGGVGRDDGGDGVLAGWRACEAVHGTCIAQIQPQPEAQPQPRARPTPASRAAGTSGLLQLGQHQPLLPEVR